MHGYRFFIIGVLYASCYVRIGGQSPFTWHRSRYTVNIHAIESLFENRDPKVDPKNDDRQASNKNTRKRGFFTATAFRGCVRGLEMNPAARQGEGRERDFNSGNPS